MCGHHCVALSSSLLATSLHGARWRVRQWCRAVTHFKPAFHWPSYCLPSAYTHLPSPSFMSASHWPMYLNMPRCDRQGGRRGTRAPPSAHALLPTNQHTGSSELCSVTLLSGLGSRSNAP